jgi:hypothetical protein
MDIRWESDTKILKRDRVTLRALQFQRETLAMDTVTDREMAGVEANSRKGHGQRKWH